MRTYAGTEDVVTKDKLVEQMNSEVMATFQNVLNELGNSNHKVPVLELPSNTDEIKQVMDEKVFDEPIRNRGVKLVGFAVESVTLDDDSNRKIEEYEHNSNAMMQQGRVLDVMETAAGNANGAATGFMGIGMMNMASGGMSGGVMQNAFAAQPAPQQQYDPYAKQQEAQPAPAGVKCTNCGATVTGKFCSECGTPVAAGPKKCSNCGTEVTGKFCTECGTPVNN
jgi:membrane protease subunit (stomatin/prohibitin family)